MNLRLREILSLPNAVLKFKGDEKLLDNKPVGISTDSRTLKNGELFFAIKGDQFDGHDYISQVMEKGALTAVVSSQWAENHDKQVVEQQLLIAPDTLFSMQETARYYRSKFQIPVIAITGSVGKTTAKEAVAAVLMKKYDVLRNIKSFNNHIGVPLTLFELSGEHEILVTEIGMNHIGEIDRLAYLVQPTYGMITNIAGVHLEFLTSLEGVAKAKMELFNHVPPSGKAFINWDDETLRAQNYPVKDIIRYGLKDDVDVKGRILGCNSNACYSVDVSGYEIHLRLPGRHNVYNALAAIAIGSEFEISMEDIKEALENFEPVEKRMQVHVLEGDIVLLDDSYNSNPTSCAAALATLYDLKTFVDTKKYAVLGDMLELGRFSKEEHRKLGQQVAKKEIFGLFGYGGAMKEAVHEAKRLGVSKALHFEDKIDLLNALLDHILPGDQILVKGSRAMHLEDIFEGLKKKIGGKATAMRS